MSQSKLRIGCVLISVGATLGGCIDAVEVADGEGNGSGGSRQPSGGQFGGGGWVGAMPTGGGGGFIGDVANGGFVGLPPESGGGGWVGSGGASAGGAVGIGGCATCAGGAVGTMPVGGQIELGGEGGEAP